ncbi:LysR family transcriptional regulator [Mycolicibacterium chlorophenolicum]|uniref:LysR family transcriptional regulator n=1 Tax=Mycolicibacterium chlorophenolicum TaxID=37916 RepID=UPI0007678041|nr:LysR family transcriptional regulator [Mycolicibacterium chlorophenolicum]
MVLDPRQLECFIAVAEELNLNRAAIRLHMSQPPLTRRIQRLERDLGVELFRRTPGGMELTEAGAVFLERAYRIVALSTCAVERTRLASNGEIGHLSVGYYDPAILTGIPELIRGFLDQHRLVTVSFELIAKHNQIDYLRDKVLHVGFGRHYPDEPGIVCRPVMSEPLYVAMHRSRALDWRSPATIADLRHQPLVVYPTMRPEFADEVIDLCLRAGFTPRVTIEAEDVVSCLAYVALGIAIAVVPDSATRTKPDDVDFIPLQDAPPAPLYCAHLRDNSAPTLRLFVDYLDTRLG